MDLLNHVTAKLLFFPLFFISLWLLFRTFVFIKVLGAFSKIKKKSYYLCELIFLFVALLIYLSFSGSILFGVFREELEIRFVIFIVALVFLLYVSFKGFMFPTNDGLHFINNISDITTSKFGRNNFFGFLWTHFIKISESSKNIRYRKFESFLFLLLIIGLIWLGLEGVFIYLVLWLMSQDTGFKTKLFELIVLIAILIFIVLRATKKIRSHNA